MDFYLSTPTSDVHLFSSEDGRTVQIPAAPATLQSKAEATPIVTEMPL